MSKREKQIQRNFEEVKKKIPNHVCLVAVSKTFPMTDIVCAYDCGHRDFGENKVQDLEQKASFSYDQGLKINWHFIGHLQSNKVKKLLGVKNLKYIHSIDSLKLLDQLGKYEDSLDHDVFCFLQINSSGEDEKFGFLFEDQILEAIRKFDYFHRLKLLGFMTIGKIRTNNFKEDAISSFKVLKDIRKKLGLEKLKLSMGMSHDFLWAIECGSDFVRIGSSIFGKRS